MDLFETQISLDSSLPLSEKMRPRHLNEFFGQEEVLGPNSFLRKIIVNKQQIPNLILWGPPGCGKTTFARLLKGLSEAEFVQVNAVDTGAKKLKEIGQQARDRKLMMQKATILFVDEIHRFNRAQQDVLLPFTERGDLSLVGATTENPSYELNSALLSRCRVLVFEKLTEKSLRALVKRSGEKLNLDFEKSLSPEAMQDLLFRAQGDGRKLLNILEQVADYLQLEPDIQFIDQEQFNQIAESTLGGYDKAGDEHYNCISAFIKSVRGSDADAALYYLARMIKGGEDPVFIARRLVILASEDIGNADPRALMMATSGLQAVELVGLPEAGINLAHVTTYLASAPKSNRSYLGWRKALELVENTGPLLIPKALRSAQTKLAKSLGFGKDYKYSHDSPTGWIKQDFLPKELVGEKIYEPVEIGFEKTIIEYQKWKKSQSGSNNN